MTAGSTLDIQVGSDIWQSDDVLGWLYESYNSLKKKAHKDSKDKTEYNKVSLQSQIPESVFPQVHTFPSSLAAYILSKPAHYLTS